MGPGHLIASAITGGTLQVRFRDGEEGCSIMRCGEPSGPADLRFAVHSQTKPDNAHLYLPDEEEPVALTWTARTNGYETTLPRVGLHAVVKYSLER